MSATRSRVLAAAAVAAALSLGYLAQGTFAAGGMPANKVAAAGATPDILRANSDETVLDTFVKINNPTDLVLSVSLECAIYTKVTSSAGASSDPAQSAMGKISIRVTIDNKIVPVSTDDPGNGEVTFCNRTQTQHWTDGTTNEDANDMLTQSTDTRDANAFNWMALNVGSNYPSPTADNVHHIQVVARWATAVSDANQAATAIVGKRTLVLDPVKAAHGATVTDLN